MLRLAADENLHHPILVGLRRRLPDVDVVTAQDAGLTGRPDDEVLAWAAAEGRVLVTHDVSTVPPLAWRRVERGEAMPGVILVPDLQPRGRMIDDLVLLVRAYGKDEIADQVHYLPL